MKERSRVAWIASFLLSALFMTICSKCSILCPFNDWYDPNCFFTVGKGMLHGLVPYRDLFEQKGPLLYFIHALAYLISPSSFAGVYVLEILSFQIVLYYAWKTASLYLTREGALRILPVYALLITASLAFFKGDSAEEFCLPMLTVSLYHLLKWNQLGRTAPRPWLFVLGGLFAGCVAWIKYSMLGFWVGAMLCLFLLSQVPRRGRLIALGCAGFFAGFALATLPWLIYFGRHRAIGDWFYCYFYVNATIYAGAQWFAKPLNIVLGVLINALTNPFITFLIVTGLWRRGEKPDRVLLIPLCLLLCNIYLGDRHFLYYQLILSPFAVPGLARFAARDPLRIFRRGMPTLTAGCAALALLTVFVVDSDRYLTRREELPQYQFAQIIRQTPGATLLNYGFLDAGFYMSADVLPVNRFFCRLNLPDDRFPIMMEEQNEIVARAKVDYVVIESSMIAGWSPPALYENYEMVAEMPLDKGLEGNRGYALFLRKETARGDPD